MFGLDPSLLPWWGWILCGLGLAIFGWIVGSRGDDTSPEFGRLMVSILLYGLAAVSVVVGIYRFIKWHESGFL